MRALLILVAVVVIAGIVGIMTGFINLSGKSGELPRVAVDGGRLPSVAADVGSVDVGTKNTSVSVPKVEVGTTEEKVALPTVDVKKADGK